MEKLEFTSLENEEKIFKRQEGCKTSFDIESVFDSVKVIVLIILVIIWVIFCNKKRIIKTKKKRL